MRSRLQLIGLGLLIAVLTGCAYQAAMKRGDRAAAGSDWVAAIAAYQEAVDTKARPEAEEALQAARDNATETGLEEARDAIAIGDYEIAIEKLDFVVGIEGDNPEAFDLRQDIQRTMNDKTVQLWEIGDIRGSYTLAIRTRDLFGSTEELAAHFAKVRGHLKEQAEVRMADAEFEDALKTIRTITEFEADQTAMVAPVENKILNAWADHLVQNANTQNRRGYAGAAAALFARAYEVAGRSEDLQEARKIAAKLEPRGVFYVDATTTGTASRARAIQDAVLATVAKAPNVALKGGKAKLTIRINARPSRCTEKSTATPKTVDYVSGQIEVPNPEYEQLVSERENAQTEHDQAARDAEQMWPDVERAEADHKRFDAEIAEATKVKSAAEGKLSQATGQMEGSMKRRDELNARLESLRTSGAPVEQQVQVEDQLGAVGKLIAEWQGEVLDAEMAVDEANTKMRAIEVERGPASEHLKRLQEAYEAIVKVRTENQQLLSQLSSKIATTKKTVWEDVPAVFEYEEKEWTRTCSAPVDVTVKPRWSTDLPTQHKYTPEGETTDVSHPGHDKAKVAENKKGFPKSDQAIISESDTATADEVAVWILELVDDHYKVATMEATMALTSDPERATSDLVGLYVGATERLSEGTLSTFAAHVKSHYGLERLELLQGGGAGEM